MNLRDRWTLLMSIFLMKNHAVTKIQKLEKRTGVHKNKIYCIY